MSSSVCSPVSIEYELPAVAEKVNHSSSPTLATLPGIAVGLGVMRWAVAELVWSLRRRDGERSGEGRWGRAGVFTYSHGRAREGSKSRH